MRSTKRSTLNTENTIETLAAEKGGALRREREREGGMAKDVDGGCNGNYQR